MLSTEILYKLSILYDFSLRQVHFVQEAANIVYIFYKNNQSYFLRICSSEQNIEDLQTEIEWMLFLFHEGVNVALPYPSVNKRYIEQVKTEKALYIIVVFEAVKGMTWGYYQRNMYDADSHYKLGALMGRMHRINKKFQKNFPNLARDSFEKVMIEALNETLLRFSSHTRFFKMGNEMIKKVRQFSKSSECYGLLHNDFHAGNIAVREGNYTILDFDSAILGWFAYDIAVALYNILININLPKITKPYDLGKFIIKNYIDGYLSENVLKRYWIDLIPFFIQYRMLYCCCTYYDAAVECVADQKLMTRSNLELDKFF